MTEYRCKECRHILFRSDAPRGRVEIVCPDRRCRAFQTVWLASAEGVRAALLTA